MNIHPIRNETDYRKALRELSAWFDDEPEPGSSEGDRFEVMLTVAETYEAKNFPTRSPISETVGSRGSLPKLRGPGKGLWRARPSGDRDQVSR